MKKDDFYSFMRKIPKAEIHLHVEGTVHPETVKELLSRPSQNGEGKITDIAKLFKSTNLTDFIQSFLYVQGLFQTPKDLRVMLRDVERYLRENNIVYAELFFAPSYFLKKGFTFSEMVSTFHEALGEIQKDGTLTLKLLIDVGRTFGPESAQNNLTEVLQLLNSDIIGIGLGGDEKKGPAREFGTVFDLARKEGLHVVAHAGEDAGPESIWDALEVLKAERIGHGLAAIEDAKLRDHLKARQIPIEICVSSNVNLAKGYVSSPEKHPVRKFFDEGLLTVINTDDPTFFDATLIGEFWILHSKLNFSMNEIKKLVLNGFEASFLTQEQKSKYFDQVESAWAAATVR